MKNLFKANKIKTVIAAAVAAIISCTLFPACNMFEKDEDASYFRNALSYSEFGAAGDGKTDDFEAIKRAHEAANEQGRPVKAESKKTYYIAPHESTITVKTSTDWGKAKFIIDDKSAREDSQEWWYPLFDVRPDKPDYEVTLPENYSLAAGQKNVKLTFDYDVLLRIVNSDKKDFIRYGNNQDNGDARQEVILVDRAGNVAENTPILRDFAKVTLMKAHSAAEDKIVLRGGIFTTIANDDTRIMHYFNRAIDVKRSQTVVKNVTHYVTGEGDTGSPYNGFFLANYANNVTFENCVMTGHKIYKNGNGVDQGTYDTRLNCCNNVTYRGCTQSNDMTDNKFWGIMCSDYCKNLVMENCKLSRFDAHHGVYNATIINCQIGQNVSVCGGGTFLMENTTRYATVTGAGLNRFITLRYDYGSFWDGDIIIKNSQLVTASGLNYAVDVSWYEWDFGFECSFPKTVTLDNVKIIYADKSITYNRSYVFGYITQTEGQTPEYMLSSVNPVALPEKIILKNKQTEFGITPNTLGWLSQLTITEE